MQITSNSKFYSQNFGNSEFIANNDLNNSCNLNKFIQKKKNTFSLLSIFAPVGRFNFNS